MCLRYRRASLIKCIILGWFLFLLESPGNKRLALGASALHHKQLTIVAVNTPDAGNLVINVTGLCSLTSCIPCMGNNPRNDQGRGLITHCCAAPFLCQTAQEEMAIGDIRVVVRFDCSFFTSCPRVFTLTALQIAGRCVPLSCSRLPCVSYGRCRHHSRQQQP